MSLRAVRQDELDEAFALYKQGLYAYIEQVFGWNEAFQRERFGSSYPLETLYWSEGQGQNQALLCLRETAAERHVHLLLILPEFQRQGLGRSLMQELQRQAAQNGQVVTLSSFKLNTGALAFYQRLGYTIVGEDADFYDLSLRPASG